jgi:hypothetical protein
MPAKSAKPSKELACPKCESAMEAGVVHDRGYGNLPLQQTWGKGKTEFSMKSGLKTTFGTRTVATWRCTGCGYLESYAK